MQACRKDTDYSAFVMLVLDRRGVLWIDADLDRRDTHRIAVDAVRFGRLFNPLSFAIEANGFQRLLADSIARLSREAGLLLPVVGWSNTASKATRIRGLAPYLARGEFRFRRHSPGAALLVEQLKGFPTCRHDDGPDALAMALEVARERFYADPASGAASGEIAGLSRLTDAAGLRRLPRA